MKVVATNEPIVSELIGAKFESLLSIDNTLFAFWLEMIWTQLTPDRFACIFLDWKLIDW